MSKQSGIPSQPRDDDNRLRKGDIGLAKMFITGKPITLNELHGILLGVSFGLIVAALIIFGNAVVATLAAVAIPGVSLMRLENIYSIGGRTMSHEPWWFLAPYSLALVLALLVLALIPL